MAWLLLIPVLLPIVAGLGLLILNFKERMQRQIYVASVIIVNAALSIIFMFTVPAQVYLRLLYGENQPDASGGWNVHGLWYDRFHLVDCGNLLLL